MNPFNAAPPARKSKLPLILGLVAGFLVLCCGGTTIAATLTSGKRATPQPQASATIGVGPVNGDSSPSPSPAAASSAPAPTAPPATTAAPVAPAPTTAPTTRRPTPGPTTKKPPPPAPTTPSYQQGVTAGAFCSPRGALGYTSTGKLMQCKPSATDTRNRWRAA